MKRYIDNTVSHNKNIFARMYFYKINTFFDHQAIHKKQTPI